MTEWNNGWRSNFGYGVWKTAKNRPVQHYQILQVIDKEMRIKKVKLVYGKANCYNEGFATSIKEAVLAHITPDTRVTDEINNTSVLKN